MSVTSWCPVRFSQPALETKLPAGTGAREPLGTRPDALSPWRETALAAPHLLGLGRAQPSGRRTRPVTACPPRHTKEGNTQLQATPAALSHPAGEELRSVAELPSAGHGLTGRLSSQNASLPHADCHRTQGYLLQLLPARASDPASQKKLQAILKAKHTVKDKAHIKTRCGYGRDVGNTTPGISDCD